MNFTAYSLSHNRRLMAEQNATVLLDRLHRVSPWTLLFVHLG